MIGQLLDRRYLITQSLSSGGFGETYLAQDTRIPGNPPCVVKQLKSASSLPAHMEKARQLFNREAEALAKLGDHDQIPRLLAYFTEGDEFYLVQEFIPGHTIELELKQLWSEEQVIQLLQEVLTVLAFVHAQGVIHRDIKPANIIRRQRDNKLVLIDFGAIKQVRIQPDGSGEYSSVSPGTRIGTIGYMPTEQARGKPRPSSDLFALGMIAIQALTGQHPTRFEDDHMTGETRWQHLVQISPGLAHVLARMTRYSARDRYQTANEALQAIQQLAHGHDPAMPAGLSSAQLVHELKLEWYEAGLLYQRVIQPQQSTRHAGAVRIGRDPSRCDIVLSDITVSGLHVEIFFNPEDQHFYVRNLRETNPPIIDGRSLPQGERVLNQDSRLQLGQVELQITAISVKEYSPGYGAAEYGVAEYGSARYGSAGAQPMPSPAPDAIDPAGRAGAVPYPFMPNSTPNPVPYPPPPVIPPYHQEAVSSPPNQQPVYLAGSGHIPPDSVQPLPAIDLEATQPRLMQVGWSFWLGWVGATAMAGAIGAMAFYLPGSLLGGFIKGAIMGGCVGLVQWLMLRPRIPTIAGWILASVIAQALSFAFVTPFPPSLIAVGILPGIAQWLILQGKVPQAGWWVATKAIADPLGLLIGFLVSATIYPLAGGVAGLISGAITGGVMVWLLQRSNAAQENG